MKIHDLSLTLYEGMPRFPVPWYPSPEFTFILTPDNYPSNSHRYAGKVALFNHGGTHLDSPLHYNYFGSQKTIDQVPAEVLVGPCVVLRFYDKGNLETISAADLEKAAQGQNLKGKRLLILTGYTDRNWEREDYFSVSPYLTEDAGQWMVDKGVALVGIDFQTDKPGDGSFPAHNVLLRNEVYILEYLCNCSSVPDQCLLVVAPLKLKGMEASTCRVFALEL
jgi:arylformamidase